MSSSTSVLRPKAAADAGKRGSRSRGALFAFLFFLAKGLFWLASLATTWMLAK